MRAILQRQRDYWNSEIARFDAIYSREKNGFARWLDSVFRKDMYQRYEYTLRHAEPIRERVFLDVGCGTGRYAFELARRGCRHVTGIDISEAMIEHCRRVADAEGLSEKTEFVRSDLLEFASKRSFHVVIGIGLFDYVGDPLPLIRRMRQNAADSVIVSFPRFWTWRAPVRKIRLSLRGCAVFFYSKKKIVSLLREAGFASYEIQVVGKLYCVTARV